MSTSPFSIFSAGIAAQIDQAEAERAAAAATRRRSPRTRARNPQDEFQETLERLRRLRRGSLLSDESDPNNLKDREQDRWEQFFELWGSTVKDEGFQNDTETETVVGDTDSGEESEQERSSWTTKKARDIQTPKRSSIGKKMAVKTYTWISLWFLITTPVIMWDVGYCFMRPRSMVGGDLHWIWKPYEIYERVDLLYGPPAYNEGDGFTNAQSLMNIIETFLNVYYLYLAHVVAWPPATLVGFTSAALTLAKTVLYWAQEYFCNYCATGQNTAKDLIVYWILPNGFWIVVPTFIVYVLGKDLCAQLVLADKMAQGVKASKKK